MKTRVTAIMTFKEDNNVLRVCNKKQYEIQ